MLTLKNSTARLSKPAKFKYCRYFSTKPRTFTFTVGGGCGVRNDCSPVVLLVIKFSSKSTSVSRFSGFVNNTENFVCFRQRFFLKSIDHRGRLSPGRIDFWSCSRFSGAAVDGGPRIIIVFNDTFPAVWDVSTSP